VPVREQPLQHRVLGHAVGVQQLLELVEQEAQDAGLRPVEPGHHLVAAGPEGLHASFW
jgi:hypothetical protein